MVVKVVTVAQYIMLVVWWCEGCNGCIYTTSCLLSGGCEGYNGCTIHYAGCLMVVKVVMVVQYIMLVAWWL